MATLANIWRWRSFFLFGTGSFNHETRPVFGIDLFAHALLHFCSVGFGRVIGISFYPANLRGVVGMRSREMGI